MQFGDWKIEGDGLVLVGVIALFLYWSIVAILRNLTIWFRGYPPESQLVISQDDEDSDD